MSNGDVYSGQVAMSYRRVGSMRRDPWLMAVWSGEQPLIERASSADLVSWRWTPARCRSNSRRSCCWTGPRVSTCPSSGRQSRSKSLPFSRGHGGFGIGADVWRPIRHCRSGGGLFGAAAGRVGDDRAADCRTPRGRSVYVDGCSAAGGSHWS
jgi:hypothetical protein